MRNRVALASALVAFAVAADGLAQGPSTGRSTGKERPDLELTSSEVKEGERLPVSATCDGEGQSPVLVWRGGDQAKSYVLVLDDLDAPNGTFSQWVLFDIPREITSIAHGGTAGTSATNGENRTGYQPPCPQKGSGVHRYRFVVYALDTDRLGPRAGASRAEVDASMSGHVLQRATLSSLYGRP
jgi:Raf kinase inhibitor-like YbhB/YbcL family protein